LLLDAVADALLEMFVRAPDSGDANHGYIQMTTSNHVIKSGKNLLVG
jgi:hypothetical protein